MIHTDIAKSFANVAPARNQAYFQKVISESIGVLPVLDHRYAKGKRHIYVNKLILMKRWGK